MIEEAYVSFEVAKLLKEKGFVGKCRTCYTTEGRFILLPSFMLLASGPIIQAAPGCLAPTQQMVCEWLRQTAAYHIEVLASYHFRVFDGYSFEVFSLLSEEHVDFGSDKGIFKSAPEACEAAIKFCLDRLPNKED